MRPIIILALLGLYCGLSCGQGSGDDHDVVVITPTNNSGLSTDGTNDSGSGDDDEDGTASGDRPTVRSTAGSTTVGDDEDIGSGASGSGSGFVPPTTGTLDALSTATDIYISESTTVSVPVSTKKRTTQATTETTTETTTRKKTTTSVISTKATTRPNVRTSQTPTNGSDGIVTVMKSTKESESPTTPVMKSTMKKESKRPTTRAMTSTIPTKKVPESMKTEPATYPTQKPSTEFEKEMDPTTKDVMTEGETTSQPPNILARKGDKKKEGFTLTTEVIIGVVACALLALLFIAFLMYRLKKRDEGSYLLDDSCGNPGAYKKGFGDKEAFV